MESLSGNGLGNFLDDLKAGAASVITTAAAPIVTQAVKEAQPTLQQSTTTGIKQWISEHSGMLIIGLLALVAIIVGIVVIARGRNK